MHRTLTVWTVAALTILALTGCVPEPQPVVQNKPSPSESSPPEPVAEIPAPPKVTKHFSGPISVTDVDGYSLDLDFGFAYAGDVQIDVLEEKPGFSTVTRALLVDPVVLTNTTAARNLSFDIEGISSAAVPHQLVFAALFPLSGAVCSAGLQTIRGESFCFVAMTHSRVSGTIAEGASLTVPAYTGVTDRGSYFAVPHVPDSVVDQVAAEFSAPVGYAVIHMGGLGAKDKSSRFQAQLCGTEKFGMSRFSVLGVVGVSEQIASCAGHQVWSTLLSPAEE